MTGIKNKVKQTSRYTKTKKEPNKKVQFSKTCRRIKIDMIKEQATSSVTSADCTRS